MRLIFLQTHLRLVTNNQSLSLLSFKNQTPNFIFSRQFSICKYQIIINNIQQTIPMSEREPLHQQQLDNTADNQIDKPKPVNSSINTIFALLNSMMGGTMLALPLLFRDAGMLTSLIILLVSGFISSKTCNIFVTHLAPKDNDVQDSIKRIIKGKWYEFFCLITGVYLIMLNVLYIVLINDQFYNIIAYGFDKSNKQDSLAHKDEFTFSKMSMQWVSVISFLPLMGLLVIKNLNLIVKFTAIGVYSVLVYFIFIIYVFFDNIKNVTASQIKLFSFDIGNLAGTAALAFTIHTVVAPICKMNKNQQNNSRDLYICYAMGSAIYAIIGICGQVAIQNKQCKTGAQTIIDCFPNGSWQPLIVSIMYLLGLVTVFPCFMDVSRKRLFSAFSPKPISDKQRNIFNIGFMLVSFTFSILSPYIKLSDIMNFTGAIFCFFFVYLIPVALHFRCLYNTNPDQDSIKVYYKRDSTLVQSKDSLITVTDAGKMNPEQMCAHMTKPEKQVSRSLMLAFYGVILVIGLLTMVYGIYSSIMIFI